MKTLVTLLAVMLLTTSAFGQDIAASYRSDYAGKRYDFTVTHAQILATPDWPEDADNPPLSPRKALALAYADLATFLPDAARWEHPTITLQSLVAPHKWVYLIVFDPPSDHTDALFGPDEQMHVLALMDGTAVKPRVSPSDLVKVPVQPTH